ncbi:MAG: hypothetical protein KZQ64_03840 [gamma proteobacterium symbiont of Bathyaustriella thionipta]|nr:hypothetical protein [gamma proteobacterium symbiont of Bathyaustriella thionipta]MCU7951425.1 hypothetical protein [gamma proteobacterium symbiont of Bathyaustriella thionipta]MCU7952512.1 hypothetical protein [gamma proteobacterium symbiont of Bathyaustriella thionipta]MCU7957978.1 hypothetical protein [gamma proteobacterium symbiont of Bathyaustriella thionipta]MCU7966517.1 hypothetical protein [gamma proteobacterium symbiont of Bathyaustriella thionipta]
MHLLRNNILIIGLMLLVFACSLTLYSFYSASQINQTINSFIRNTAPLKASSSAVKAEEKVKEEAQTTSVKPTKAHLTLPEGFKRIAQKESVRESRSDIPVSLVRSLTTHLDDTQNLLEQINQTDVNVSTNSLNLLESKIHELDVIKEEVLTHLHQMQDESAHDSKHIKALNDYEQQVTDRFKQLNSRLITVVSSDIKVHMKKP